MNAHKVEVEVEVNVRVFGNTYTWRGINHPKAIRGIKKLLACAGPPSWPEGVNRVVWPRMNIMLDEHEDSPD